LCRAYPEPPPVSLATGYACITVVPDNRHQTGDTGMHEFNVVIEQDSEGWYVASVPSLPGCHTQARSLDELMERTREAIEVCLKDQEADGADLRFVGVQRLTVAA
jgi:predicted RNase H-like HicB family nuclease